MQKLLSHARHAALSVLALLCLCAAAIAPLDAQAGGSLSATARNNRCTSNITLAGSSAILEVRSGARPTNADTSAAGTLLASLTFTGNIGTCTSGVLTINTTVTQTAGSHTSGTPGHVRIKQSVANGSAAVLDIDVCGSAPCLTFTGSVVTGQTVTFSAPTLTEPGF